MSGTLYKHLLNYLDELVQFRNLIGRQQNILLAAGRQPWPASSFLYNNESFILKKTAPPGATKHQKKKDQ